MSENEAPKPAHGCVLAVVGFELIVILLALGMAASEYMRASGITLIWQYRHGGRTFRGIDLPAANLRGAVLAGADLSRASLGDLSGADLRKVNLSGASLGDLSGADLREANLSGAVGGNFHAADLREADLSGAHLYGCDLSEADLRGANLSGAVLSHANLTNAKLDEHTRLGAKWRLIWELTTAGGERRDLSGADLRGAGLAGVRLRGANLTAADLTFADLTEADLTGATVSDEQLAKADFLEGATMPDGTKWKCSAPDFSKCRP